MSVAVKQPQHPLLYSRFNHKKESSKITVILGMQAARYSPNTTVSTVAVVQFKIFSVCLCVGESVNTGLTYWTDSNYKYKWGVRRVGLD